MPGGNRNWSISVRSLRTVHFTDRRNFEDRVNQSVPLVVDFLMVLIAEERMAVRVLVTNDPRQAIIEAEGQVFVPR